MRIGSRTCWHSRSGRAAATLACLLALLAPFDLMAPVHASHEVPDKITDPSSLDPDEDVGPCDHPLPAEPPGELDELGADVPSGVECETDVLPFGFWRQVRWDLRQEWTERVLNDVDMVDGLTGYAVGHSASVGAFGRDNVVLKTTDGGERWGPVIGRLPEDVVEVQLNAVRFVTPDIGYVVGNAGTIARTTDGGQSWTRLSLPGLTQHLHDVELVATGGDPGYVVYVVGDAGRIRRSSDGGGTWATLDRGSSSMRGVSFPTPEVGYVVGDAGTALATDDAGDSWAAMPVVSRTPSVDPGAAKVDPGASVDPEGPSVNAGSPTVEPGEPVSARSVITPTLYDVTFPDPADPARGYAVGDVTANNQHRSAYVFESVVNPITGALEWVETFRLPGATLRGVAFDPTGERGQAVGGLRDGPAQTAWFTVPVVVARDIDDDGAPRWVPEPADALVNTAQAPEPGPVGPRLLSSTAVGGSGAGAVRIAVGVNAFGNASNRFPQNVIVKRATDVAELTTVADDGESDDPERPGPRPRVCLTTDEANEVVGVLDEFASALGDAPDPAAETARDVDAELRNAIEARRCHDRPQGPGKPPPPETTTTTLPPGTGQCAIPDAQRSAAFECVAEGILALEDGAPALVRGAQMEVNLMLDPSLRRLVAYAAGGPSNTPPGSVRGPRVFLYDLDRLSQRGVEGFGAPFAGTPSEAADATGVVNLRHAEAFAERDIFGSTAGHRMALDAQRHRLFVAESKTLETELRVPRVAAASLTGEFEPTLVELDVPPETKLTFLTVDAERNIVYAVTDGPEVPGDFLLGVAASFALQNPTVTLHAFRPVVVTDGDGAPHLSLTRRWSLPLESRCPRTHATSFNFIGVSKDGRTIAFPCTEVSFTNFALAQVVPGSILSVFLPDKPPDEIDEVADRVAFGYRSDPMPGGTAGVGVASVMGFPEHEVLVWRAGNQHFLWNYGRREWVGALTAAASIVGEDVRRGRLYMAGGEIPDDEQCAVKGEPGALRFLQTVNVGQGLVERACVATGLSGPPGGFVVDDTTGRLFGRASTTSGSRLVVLEDHVNPTFPSGNEEPDEFTNDIDEARAEDVTRGAETRAYGARVWWTGFGGILPGTHALKPDGTQEQLTQIGTKPPALTYENLKVHFLLGPHVSALPVQPSAGQRELYAARIKEAKLTGQLSSAAAEAATIDANSRAELTARLGGRQGRETVEAQGRAICEYGSLLGALSGQCKQHWLSQWDAGWANFRGDPPTDEEGKPVEESPKDEAEREKRRADREEFEECSLELHDRIMRELDGQRTEQEFDKKGNPVNCRPEFDGFDEDDPRCGRDNPNTKARESKCTVDAEGREVSDERSSLEERAGWTRASQCADPGDARSSPGSLTRCDLDGWSTEASASGGLAFELPAGAGSVRVGTSWSGTQTCLDGTKACRNQDLGMKDLGMVSKATAVAGDIEVSVPTLGTLTIGEVRTTATSWAMGRPKTTVSRLAGAHSEFDVRYEDVTVKRADNSVAFSCGPTGTRLMDGDAQEPECNPDEVSAAVSQVFGQALTARAPPRDLEENVSGSPGGAQAIVRMNRADRSADEVLFTLGSNYEVPGLQLSLTADGTLFNRYKVDLAGVFVESSYQIGEEKQAVKTEPGSLTVELRDGTGRPLGDGVFRITPTPGGPARECRTASDGVGSCRFTVLTPGEYEVRQTVAPSGYAREEATVTARVGEGSSSSVAFVNVGNTAAVAVSLVNALGEPLEGGAFELVHGSGGVAGCTTDAAGRCTFPAVALGGYRLTETAAPAGYQRAEPVVFALSDPGQLANIRVVNVRVGAPARVGGSSVEIVEVITGADPVVHAGRDKAGLFDRFKEALADALGFLLRHPLLALLFLSLFALLFAPLYGLVRRMDLIAAEEAT